MGMKVIALDRDAAGLDSLERELASESGESFAEFLEVDLSEFDAVEGVVHIMKSIAPDHLFHAAGIIVRRDSIDDVGLDDWDRQVDINQRASWFLTRGFCQQLESRARQGSAVLVSSVSGSLGLISGSWVYATTKAAVSSMARGFAKTYGSRGIRVNAVAPGLVETPMVVGDVRTKEIESLLDSHIPVGRLAAPEEIASASFFLLSDHASYITGVTLDVDGGWLRR